MDRSGEVCREAGVGPKAPLINTDREDLLLFVFLVRQWHEQVSSATTSASSSPEGEEGESDKVVFISFRTFLPVETTPLARMDAGEASGGIRDDHSYYTVYSNGAASGILITCLSAMLALKVPARLMLARITAPMGIVFVLVVMQSFTVGSTTMFTVSVGAWHGAVKLEGVIHGLLIGSRVLGAVSVMLLLSSVTPAHRILQALRWFRVSKGWVEIAMLMYRYTFTLLDHATDLAEAQRLRLGYCDVKRSLSSMGVLAGAKVIIRSLDQATPPRRVTLRGLTGVIPTADARHAGETDGSWSISPVFLYHCWNGGFSNEARPRHRDL